MAASASAAAAINRARGCSSPITAPWAPADITHDRDAAESAEPAEAAEPTENVDAIEPTEPIEKAEPTEPMLRNDPFEQIESAESSDHSYSHESLP